MKLMVLDGNSIVNRAFYGVRMLSAPDGTPTNAVYGFLTILQKLMREENPDGLCVAFDLKAPTFRHLKYDGYKAQRKGMPEELAVQMPILKEVLDAMGIKRYEISGYEADDIIGTIARVCDGLGWNCSVVTGDKDSFQLITDTTCVKHVKSRMGQTETIDYTPERFQAEYGFTPPKMVDLKALMGDSSDNIPGVPGIGEKTAMDLLHKFGSLDGVYANLESAEIKPAARKKLEAGKESAYMSFDLATICCDVPMEFAPEDAKMQPSDGEELYRIFKRLGFQKMIEKFELTAPKEAAERQTQMQKTCESEKITDLPSAEGVFQALSGAQAVGFYANGEIDKFVLCDGDRAFAFSADAFGSTWNELLKTLSAAELPLCGHNIKDIQRALLERGCDAGKWVFDTALAAYLLDPLQSHYDLAQLAEIYCGFSIGKQETDDGQMSLMEGDDLPVYISSAAAILSLRQVLEEKLDELGMAKLYYEVELPLCTVLAEMEQTGVLVDKTALSDYGDGLSVGIDQLQAEIYQLAGEEFNINSPKQLGVILFEKLMLPAPKKTKTGWSTNIDVLERLRGKHPIVQRIIQYRELTKLKSTYADGLLKVIGQDGRIHTKFQMTVTATGRLSSVDPNLQNIPVRKELGGELRKMFVAPAGSVLVDADYSQIELRLLADISKDGVMQAAFSGGEDVHTVTASQVFDCAPEEVTAIQRSRAKAVNFGIVYGISAFSLSQDIGVTVAEAKMYMESYLAKYHGVREYMKRIVDEAKEKGYVETLYGRRRALPELKSSNFNLRAFGERVALNMPIQGTAADIIKIAMIAVSARLKQENLKAKLILQIHDELIVECPEEETERVKAVLKEEMEKAAALSVPLTADTGVGRSWYEAK